MKQKNHVEKKQEKEKEKNRIGGFSFSIAIGPNKNIHRKNTRKVNQKAQNLRQYLKAENAPQVDNRKCRK